ncbi:hypothetical protein PDO_2968 [Rhizobium sp. PDO1-076]|uniref:hypothetical protein n=1 Tax=Rhizobium sp. PDO1-076 TaxID=1125979 RepID=UPI00024E2D8B|nr:hypothetical protein [Rhizobium sp. PDO1-076]EHS49761.1 hypothetical protein PDO_2968 [Rhizobium sp. PDO1-076]
MRKLKNIRSGNWVLPRPDSALYRQRYDQRHEAGLAIEVAQIPGWGIRVTVKWPNGSIGYPEESQLILMSVVEAPK